MVESILSSVNGDAVLAVALVINRSRDGPAFVYHYPPRVSLYDENVQPPDASELEDVVLERLSLPASREAVGQARINRAHDDHLTTESGFQIVPWEHFVGFPTYDLASILTPKLCYHKKLFQLSLDPVHCVCCPIHVPENGRWKRPKKVERPKMSKTPDDRSATPDADGVTRKQGKHPKDTDPIKGEKDEEKRSSMTMFNIVFFVNPKHCQVREIIALLYSNVIKKINKAYKYSQQHSDFIWKESKRILAAKDKGREEKQKLSDLWKDILQNSSLACSIRDIYEAISTNKIASIHLEAAAGVLSPSVQIPMPFYTPDLPVCGDKSLIGLPLTTANTMSGHDTNEEADYRDRTFALLLMDDAKKIIGELQNDRDSASTQSLINFVRLCKPTMSFHQIGQTDALTPDDVRKYAQHFIYWRRAIAVPPLHARDTYIMSPNCDPSKLPQDSEEWQRSFPIAPPLPSFLADLSTSPRPFKLHCPAKSYRPIYLQMLAWLMRSGWVTQLCTFAYVVVWPEIIYEVEYAIEAEELAAVAAATAAQQKPTKHVDFATEKGPRSARGDSPNRASHDNRTFFSTSRASPHNQTEDPTTSTTEHVAEKARLERLAIKAHREAADKATAHGRKVTPTATKHPSTNDAAHLIGLTPYIIRDARKATGKESRYLLAIAQRFEDEKVKSAWQVMRKYFDGRSALERIALLHDTKRKETWNLLTAMSEWLICVRHW